MRVRRLLLDDCLVEQLLPLERNLLILVISHHLIVERNQSAIVVLWDQLRH